MSTPVTSISQPTQYKPALAPNPSSQPPQKNDSSSSLIDVKVRPIGYKASAPIFHLSEKEVDKLTGEQIVYIYDSYSTQNFSPTNSGMRSLLMAASGTGLLYVAKPILLEGMKIKDLKIEDTQKGSTKIVADHSRRNTLLVVGIIFAGWASTLMAGAFKAIQSQLSISTNDSEKINKKAQANQ